jgi:hypothetical protein
VGWFRLGDISVCFKYQRDGTPANQAPGHSGARPMDGSGQVPSTGMGMAMAMGMGPPSQLVQQPYGQGGQAPYQGPAQAASQYAAGPMGQPNQTQVRACCLLWAI